MDVSFMRLPLVYFCFTTLSICSVCWWLLSFLLWLFAPLWNGWSHCPGRHWYRPVANSLSSSLLCAFCLAFSSHARKPIARYTAVYYMRGNDRSKTLWWKRGSYHAEPSHNKSTTTTTTTTMCYAKNERMEPAEGCVLLALEPRRLRNGQEHMHCIAQQEKKENIRGTPTCRTKRTKKKIRMFSVFCPGPRHWKAKPVFSFPLFSPAFSHSFSSFYFPLLFPAIVNTH